MAYFVGIDGGGTRTTVGIADWRGREVLRRAGPAGIVDPRNPNATAELLVRLVEEAARAAGARGPAVAVCAGLAGVGNPAERLAVERILADAGVARRVQVVSDGETALRGAFGGGAGILAVAGTGSVAWGRSADGRVERCGGWGMIVGDEGSAYAMGRDGLRAALLSADGRGAQTELLGALLRATEAPGPDAIPPWAGRATKSEVAQLAVHVLRAAESGDAVALGIALRAASELAAHVDALVARLGPWSAPPRVATHGGLAGDAVFRPILAEALRAPARGLHLVVPQADAVSGALELARSTCSADATAVGTF